MKKYPNVLTTLLLLSICLFLLAIGTYLSFVGNKTQTIRSKAAEMITPFPPPAFHGWLHTQGTKLVGEDGATVRFWGVGDQDFVPAKLGKACWQATSDDEVNNVTAWGFNNTEFEVAWGNLEPNPPTPDPNHPGQFIHHWNQDYLKDMDSAVARMSAQNRYLVIKFKPIWGSIQGQPNACHTAGIPSWIYPGKDDTSYPPDQRFCDFLLKPNDKIGNAPYSAQQGSLEMWKFIVDHYKNNSHVAGFDLLNEPYADKKLCDAKKLEPGLVSYYKTVEPIIHTINSHPLIMFQDSGNGAVIKNSFTISQNPHIPNGVYTWHLYQDSWDGAKQVADAYTSHVQDWNIPQYMAEFAPPGMVAKAPDWLTNTQRLMDYLKTKQISWEITGYEGEGHIVDKQTGPRFDLIQIMQSGFDSAPPLTVTPPTGTVTPPTGTITPPPGGNITLNLKLKFQGITKAPIGSEKTMRVNVIAVDSQGARSTPAAAPFTSDENGVFSGSVSLNTTLGAGHYVLVKGPKHVQKKVCTATPTETAPGTYSCSFGAITLSSGTNSLDFSGIISLVGDLDPQNGIVDSYDISLVRNNLGSKDAKLLSEADLNLDGIIDSQDYSLVIASLSIKSDEK